MASSAASAPTGSFRITHSQSSSTAEDRDRDISLRQEFALSVSSAVVTVAVPAGSVPDGDDVPGVPLTLRKSTVPGKINLAWDASCRSGDSDYAIYEGVLGNFTSHLQRMCGTGGLLAATLTPASGNRYYLVVPVNPDGVEGSYGTASNGTPRPASASACFPQQFAACP